MRRFFVAAVLAGACAAGSGSGAGPTLGVFGVYKHSNGNVEALRAALTSAVVQLGSDIEPVVIECAHPTSIDVPTDDRIAVGARPVLLQGARRQHADLVDTGMVAEYLGHTDALRAFLASSADVGLVLYHPTPLPSAAASRLRALVKAAEVWPSEDSAAGPGAAAAAWHIAAGSAVPAPAKGDGSSLQAPRPWDILLLGYDVAPAAQAQSVLEAAASALQLGGSKGRVDVVASAGRSSRTPLPGLPPLARASSWRGMSAYAVTRAGASALLASALPMNVRYWAQVVALEALGEVRVVWAPDASIRVTSSSPEPPVTCDLCDLPPDYNRFAHIRNQLTMGGLLGYAVGLALVWLMARVRPTASWTALWAAVNSAVRGRASSKEALSSSDSGISMESSGSADGGSVAAGVTGLGLGLALPAAAVGPPGSCGLRRACRSLIHVLRHPVTQVAVLGVAGYLGSLPIVQGPWPAEQFTASGQLGALERVPLPGPPGEAWQAFVETVNSTTSKVRQATVSTLTHANLDRLHASAAWWGGSISVLGMHDPRFVEWGKGFGVKLELVHEHLRTLPADDLFLFTDAFDVLMMASTADLRDAFLHTSKLVMARERADPAGASPPRVPSILFSAEFFCHPDPNRTVFYPASDHAYPDFPHLNSGTYVGRAGDLLAVMDRFANYTLDDDDQRYWTTAYLASREDPTLPRIILDHENDVFLCMSGYRIDWHLNFDPAIRRYKYKRTPGLPAVIHFNGRKDDVAPFFEALQMQWTPYSLKSNKALRIIVAILALLALPVGVSIGRALDSLGFGLGSPGGGYHGSKAPCGTCAGWCRRHVVAASSIAAAGAVPLPAGHARRQGEKGDE